MNKSNSMEERWMFQQMGNWTSTSKKKKILTINLGPYTKMDSKWTKDLNAKHQILVKKKIEENL